MSAFLRSLLVCVAACLGSAAVADEVVTLAGNGAAASSGDGGPATAAGVSGPFGIAVGPDGAIFVCETGGHRLRRIDTQTGVITTIAGTGERGYAGDGGPATAALLDEPYEIAFDRVGSLVFVDMKSHVVRRIDRETGIIQTIAGTGGAGFSGDGGPAIAARLNQPHSIVFDRDDRLYIADIRNHRIRRVDLASGRISTFAGTGGRGPAPDGGSIAVSPLNGPRALARDGDGNLIVTLREGNAVYRIDLTTQTLHHLAGTGAAGDSGDGGDARAARLSGPKGVAVAADGTIFLADTESHTIRSISPGTNIIRTLVGTGRSADGPAGPPLKCGLDRPHGVCVGPDGGVLIGDSNNNRVRWLPVP